MKCQWHYFFNFETLLAAYEKHEFRENMTIQNYSVNTTSEIISTHCDLSHSSRTPNEESNQNHVNDKMTA